MATNYKNRAATRYAHELRGRTQAQLTATVNDRISRAYLQQGDARDLALDHNAHLVTALREQRIWPTPR